MTEQERQAFIRVTPEEWEKIVAEAERDSRTLRELNTLSAKSRISRKEQMLSEIYQSMITLSGETETKLADLLGGLFQKVSSSAKVRSISTLAVTVAFVAFVLALAPGQSRAGGRIP